VGGLALLITIGTLLLMLPGVGQPMPLSFDEALFTATSALSVTGLSIITPFDRLTRLGQLVLLSLIQVGGLGFMVFATIALRIMGRRLSFFDRLALSDSLGLLSPRSIARVSTRVVMGALVIEGVGFVLLWIHWYPQLGVDAWWYALFHAVSAFCNAGFDLFLGRAGYTNIPGDFVSLLILGVLIFLGGLGIPVLGDLIFQRRRLSLHTRITLVISAVLIVGGAVAMLIGETGPQGTMAEEPWSTAVYLSFFQSVSARTAGFTPLANFPDLRPASQFIITLLMFIGCAPASMGGGITTGTLAVLAITLWGYVRRLPAPVVAGRTVGTTSVQRAVAVLVTSLVAVGVATWLILITHPTARLEEALLEVVSAFATTGLSLAFTDNLNFFGQVIIMLMMFWGRLGALTIVLALARRSHPQPVFYPEEQLYLG
jgi:trk system potassium uptake protein TrkH